MFIKLISVNSPRGINNDEKEGDIFMCQTVLNHFRGYEGLSQTEQIDKLADELEAAGIEVVSPRFRKGFNITHFVGDEYVFTKFIKKTTGESYFTIFDRTIYDKYLVGRGGITVASGSTSPIKWVRLYSAPIADELHRLTIKEFGQSLDNGLVVDHIFMNPFINTSEALRPCTHSQNKRHSLCSLRRVLDEIARSREPYEFIYDPSVDFTNTGYAYVLHKMLGIGTWEDLRDYNIDYIKRNNASLTDLYSSLSAMVKADIDPKFANESWYRAITAF